MAEFLDVLKSEKMFMQVEVATITFLRGELLIAKVYHLVHDRVKHSLRIGRVFLLVSQRARLILVVESLCQW